MPDLRCLSIHIAPSNILTNKTVILSGITEVCGDNVGTALDPSCVTTQFMVLSQRHPHLLLASNPNPRHLTSPKLIPFNRSKNLAVNSRLFTG